MKIEPLSELRGDELYDLGIAAIGYEERSRFGFENHVFKLKKKIALEFMDRQIHSFSKNKEFFESSGFGLCEASTSAVENALESYLGSLGFEQVKEGVRFAVDVSSLTRTLTAHLCYVIKNLGQRLGVQIVTDFIYSHAKFSTPADDFGSINFRGPVIPELSGWAAEVDRASALVLGMGYEKDIALGLAEEIEPGYLVVFVPTGHDQRYTEAISDQNSDFLEHIPEENRISYDVFDWFGTFISLNNVVSALQDDYRTILTPLGPKTFSLCCILSGIERIPHVSVWRVSAGEFGDPVDRSPDGRISCLRVTW